MPSRAPRRTIHEPARDIPVLFEADIIVVGGGTTVRDAPVARIQDVLRALKMPLHANEIN